MEIASSKELRAAIRKQRADRLARCKIFSCLQVSQLSSLADRFSEASFEARTKFINQDETAPILHVIVSDLVEVFITSDQGERMTLAEISPVSTIGEMSYFQHGLRAASARTIHFTQGL